jgi:DNA modification methylase
MTNSISYNGRTLELIDPKLLKQHPRNSNKHPIKQKTLLKASVAKFGFNRAIFINGDDVILAGHAMHEAALANGLETVPVIRVPDMPEAEQRAFMLADNRLAEFSEFDREMLSKELSFLLDAEFDIGVTGFDMGDIDLGFGTDDQKSSAEPPVELPGSDAKAVSRLCDLWLIGPHRLYCGDARDVVSYEALLAGELAQMVFCDGPYNVKIGGHVSGLGKIVHREFAYASGEYSDAEFIGFLRSTFKLLARFSVEGSIHYQCMDWRHIQHMLDAADGIYSMKNLVVWDKQSAGMGSFYRSQHELVFVFKSGNEPHINTFKLGENGRFRTNIWSYPGVAGFRKGRQEDLEAHPTVKPVGMVADAILDCSKRNGLILDAFAGSGTTLLAAARTGRRGAGIEIDPLYVDTAIRRLETATGLTAMHADGESFAEKCITRLSAVEVA